MIDFSFHFRPSTQDEILRFVDADVSSYDYITAEMHEEFCGIFEITEKKNCCIVWRCILEDYILRNHLPISHLCGCFSTEKTRNDPKEADKAIKEIIWKSNNEENAVIFQNMIEEYDGKMAMLMAHDNGILRNYFTHVSVYHDGSDFHFKNELTVIDKTRIAADVYKASIDNELLHRIEYCSLAVTLPFMLRSIDGETQKLIPLSEDDIYEINNALDIFFLVLGRLDESSFGKNEHLKVKEIKEQANEFYDIIWGNEDLNDEYMKELKLRIAHMFRLIRGIDN